MNNTTLQIQQVAITALNPAPYNPRKWDREAEEHLRESITRFGLVDPIIVNNARERNNIVIGGHFRLKIAKELGCKEVPVVYVSIPDIAREKELNLRLNRNTGEWDIDLLKAFDVELLLDVGFADADLAHIWDENLGVEDDDFNIEKELAAIKEPKTKVGEIYTLGKHRIICGDATDPAIVKKLVGDQIVTMLYCDHADQDPF